MNLRAKIILSTVSLVTLAVTGSGILVLRQAAADKRSYVTEVNSLLAPQFREVVDRNINQLMRTAAGLDFQNENAVRTSVQTVREEFKGALALLKYENTGKQIFLQFQDVSDDEVKKLAETMRSISKDSVSKSPSFRMQEVAENVFGFNDGADSVFLLAGNRELFQKQFEFIRGKEAFIINSKGSIKFSSDLKATENESIANDLVNSGADLFATERKFSDGRTRSLYFSRLGSFDDMYVVVSSPRVEWVELVEPIIESSFSLLLILNIIAILVALSVSKSIAEPIENIADQIGSVGIGDLHKIKMDISTPEVFKLGKAFNKMIRNLQQREAQLQEANRKLVQSESLAAIGRIGAGIAHEVKNPLSSILSYGQLLEMSLKKQGEPVTDTKIEKIKNYNKMMMDDTRRASRIINDLLTFARQKEVQLISESISKFVIEAGEKLAPFCREKNIEYSLLNEISEDASEFVEMDREQMYQVVFNLVQNATHAFTGEQKNSPKITLKLFKRNASVVIQVADNGCGMSEETITRIFEPFFSTKKIGEGSGLGLAICYGIVQKHNGHIYVSSKLGEGTQFEIELPLKEKARAS